MVGGGITNRTSIEWVINPDGTPGFSWNPIVGCLRGCSYCYARRQAKRFKQRCEQCYEFVPHLHGERLEEPLKRRKPTTIFLGSMAEMWGPGVDPFWLADVYDAVHMSPQHMFLSLTKEPGRMEVWLGEDDLPNWWMGTSVETEAETYRLDDLLGPNQRFVSFEPLLGPITELVNPYFDWAIVGAQSGPGARPPYMHWVKDLVDNLQSWSTPVFVKDNCPWDDAWGPKPRALPYLPQQTPPKIAPGRDGGPR